MITQDPYITEALTLDWGLDDLAASRRASDPECPEEFEKLALIMSFVQLGLASIESKFDPATGRKGDLLTATPRLKQYLKRRKIRMQH